MEQYAFSKFDSHGKSAHRAASCHREVLGLLNGDEGRREFRLPSVMESRFPHAVRFAISVDSMQQTKISQACT